MTPPRGAPTAPPQNASSAAVAASPGAANPLVLVAAVAANGVIGADNRLPWRLPDDLKHFRALTTGHAVIMGRRTWESLPRALPGRQNIVVTRRRDYVAREAEIAATLDEALACVRLPPPVFCIGGGELYRLALPRATTLQLTEIARAFDGDVRFPAVSPAEWREVAREEQPAVQPDGFAYAFVTYERIAPAHR